MTTVQELSVLHRRYADISHRFRAGWTFHQFLQSLGKTLSSAWRTISPRDFQDLYTGLKEISQNLNASESERMRHRLDVDRPPAHASSSAIARRGGYQSHARTCCANSSGA